MNLRPTLRTGGVLVLGVLALGAVESGMVLAMRPGSGNPSSGWAPMPGPADGVCRARRSR